MTGRVYQGMTPEQRLNERRERLIAAAYMLYADLGFANTSIEALCMEARISNRAFYECVTSREELMETLYNRCVDDSLAAVARAVQDAPDTLQGILEFGIPAYIRYITADRRRARIMYVESVQPSSSYLADAIQKNAAAFCQVTGTDRFNLPDTGQVDPYLVVLGLNGAMQELLVEWATAVDPPAVEDIIATVVHIFRRALTG